MSFQILATDQPVAWAPESLRRFWLVTTDQNECICAVAWRESEVGHYTLNLAVRRQSPCSSSSSGSSFSLSHSFATDFRRLFSNKIDNNRRPCAQGRTLAHGRWVRRAIRNTGLSESVSVSPGRNRLGPPKQCNFLQTLRPI